MENVVMHIDVNNAFLSWSAIYLLNNGFKKDIRKEVAVIGGDETKRHGIVLAKSMEAKKYGIVTAETLFSARRKYPDLNIYPANYPFYMEMSKKLFNLIKKYTPDIEIVSCDECFLDYNTIASKYKSPNHFAKLLKYDIYNTLGFTVNIGIANNKLCAKMASDFEKPDKIHTLYSYEVKEKMHPLKVDDLYGCGKKSAAKLHELNIHTIGELAESDVDFLYKYFKNQAIKLVNSANGIDDSRVNPYYREPKGISRSKTLPYNLNNKKDIVSKMYPLVEEIGLSLREENKYAYVIHINLKDKFFKNFSHQIKLKNATNSTEVIYQNVKKLIDEIEIDEAIRLIGVGVSNLVLNNNYQLSIFEDSKKIENDQKLEEIIDKIKKDFGYNSIMKASQKTNNKN